MVSLITIGKSVKKQPISGYLIGRGRKKIALIAGIHGNESKAVVLVKSLYEYFKRRFDKNQNFLDASLFFLPVANPDGYDCYQRGNAHSVDLNRNWGCDWKPFNSWGGCGKKPFSEPETRNLRKFLRGYDVVIDYHTCNRQRNSGGFVMPGRDEKGCSVRVANLLAVELKYECRYNRGRYPGLMIDYLDKQRVKSCTIELFDAWGGEPIKDLIKLHSKAIRKLLVYF